MSKSISDEKLNERDNMKVEKHLDIEKVARRQLHEALRIARHQGQWTSANALRDIMLKVGELSEPQKRMFETHISRVERELSEMGAVIIGKSTDE